MHYGTIDHRVLEEDLIKNDIKYHTLLTMETLQEIAAIIP